MADTLANILNPVASATGTSPSTTAGVTTTTPTDAATIANNFDDVPDAADDAAEEPEPARAARHQPVHPAARPVRPGRAADEDEHAARLAHQHRADGAVDRRDGLLGSTATVDGATASSRAARRSWTFSSRQAVERHDQHQGFRPARWSIRATTRSMPGSRTSMWDGRGNNGTKYPDGNYTLAITAKDADRPDGRDLDRGVRHRSTAST